MKALQQLPAGYREIYSINLQKDWKMSLLVSFLALLITAALAVPMHFKVSVLTLFDMSGGTTAYYIRTGTMLALLFLYMIFHEAVHGIAMKICGTKKVKYGFTGLYAYTASDCYYSKKPYLFIALAPVVFWGVVLAAVNPFVPRSWFWVIYLIQICNLSGAAGDLLVTFKFAHMPQDILVRDYGVGMRVYSASEVSK